MRTRVAFTGVGLFGCFAFLIQIAIVLGLLYVAGHFVMKFW